MAHPENATLVPACVQHSVLDPDENAALRTMLPMPAARPRPAGQPGGPAPGGRAPR